MLSSNFKLTLDEVIYLANRTHASAVHDQMLIEYAKKNYQSLTGDEIFKLAKATNTWPNRGEIVKLIYKINKTKE
jgi:hypothetical protein